MRDPDRIPIILIQLQEIWEKFPDMRLGQLISNILRDPTLYYIEDIDLIDALKDAYFNSKN